MPGRSWVNWGWPGACWAAGVEPPSGHRGRTRSRRQLQQRHEPQTVLTSNGELNLDIPRDRQSTFGPQLKGKYRPPAARLRYIPIGIYARGMGVREVQSQLLEMCGLRVLPELISTVTDETLGEVTQWQQRPPEAMYPIVYFDACG